MALTNRALAFASRWFDDATVRRTFEPLIADWQREWQDASPSRRARVSLRGLAAFICAVIVSSPQIARTTAPSSVTNRVATRIALFTFPATALIILPFLLDAGGLDVVRIFLIAPHGMVLAFPFAMVAAVDAIRRHEPLPPHVERAVAVKLGILAVLLMVSFHGWVVPAANQAWRVAMIRKQLVADHAWADEVSRRRSLAREGGIARGLRELSTYELLVDPARATADESGSWSNARAIGIRRELNNRAHLAILPAMLLWLRWGMLDRPRRRWYSPLPSWLLTPMVIVAFFALNFVGINFARSAAVDAAVGAWLPTLVFLAVGLIARWWSRPMLIQRDC